MLESEELLFWERHPALSAGISALTGLFCFFEHAWWAALLWAAYSLWVSKARGVLQAGISLLFFAYAALLFSHLPLENLKGSGVFSIHSVHKYESAFQTKWIYRGSLRAFEAWSGRVPCSATYQGESPPQANGDYLLTGSLEKKDTFHYAFNAIQWTPIEGTWSLAQLRFQAKEKIRTLLHQRLSSSSASFLTALFTGDLDDSTLRFAFSRLGLQHILAISGFHFAILISFATFALSFFLPLRIRLYTLLGIATLYFLFVGNSPSVFRSYLACILYLIGLLLQRKSSGLNLLGGSLLLEILLDPLAVRTIGFQLSFLACFGILFLYPSIAKWLELFFPKRTLNDASKLPFLSQGAYIVSSFFANALGLNLAVNLTLLPLLLFHFGKFPLLSLFYNLFTPPIAALCLFLLLLSLGAHAIFPLASLPLFALLDAISLELLELLYTPPIALDFSIYLFCPSWAVVLWIALLLGVGLSLKTAPPHQLQPHWTQKVRRAVAKFLRPQRATR